MGRRSSIEGAIANRSKTKRPGIGLLRTGWFSGGKIGITCISDVSLVKCDESSQAYFKAARMKPPWSECVFSLFSLTQHVLTTSLFIYTLVRPDYI